MRISAKFGLALLVVSMLGYGLVETSFAQSLPDSIQSKTISINIGYKTDPSAVAQPLPTTGLPIDEGNIITVFGEVARIDPQAAVAIQILGPNGPAGIDQGNVTADGTYEIVFLAGGPKWSAPGEYIVKVQYGSPAFSNSTTFEYVGGNAELECDPGEILKDDKCVPEIIECKEGEKLVNGQCEPDVEKPAIVTCPPGQILVGDRCIDDEPDPPMPPPTQLQPVCGNGTIAQNGICVIDPDYVKPDPQPQPPSGGGCLIATAAYGTELAPQVQMLREIRDNTLLSTESGSSFMGTFNSLYYSFSPAVADLERENPAFKEAVKVALTPMLSSLSIMSHAEEGSEASVLALGISVIMLNIGMYIAAPAIVGFKITKRLRSRN